MGLAANVARRGGVYWWRGRIGSRQQPSRVIARSLRTRDPEVARALGTQITGMAALLRQRVRCGTMTIDEAEDEIAAFLAQFPFEVDPKVFERLDADRSAPAARAASGSLAYSTEQEFAMLADFARRMGPILERRAEEVRTRPPLVLDGIAADWVGDAIRGDLIHAEACRLLALSGTSARVRDGDRTTLMGAGFSAEDIDEIDTLARRSALREAASDWVIGPEREVIVFHLQAIGAVPTTENVARLRRATLLVLADLVRSHAHRYHAAPAHYAAIAAGAFQPGSPSRVQEPLDHVPEPVHPSASTAVNPKQDGSTHAPTASSVSFLDNVETLIRGKTQGKSREWTDKTAKQHRSLGKLFVKNAGTDDPGLMTQKHVGSYLDLLRIIPTHYGKSAADEDRTIEDILARAEDLDDNEIGLAAPTINRHRTQLSTILKYMKRNGFAIGVIDEESRAKDNEAPEDKRNTFTINDGMKIMSTIDDRVRQGALVDRDALFWVPSLAWYLLLRLGEAAGLAPNDIDLSSGLIHIRDNALRRVKTRSSRRTLPIPPELDRLGFRRFVAFRQADGSKQLFPGLFAQKSEFAAVFQKMWAPILDAALPTARVERKTMHSTRKTGNSAMHVPAVKDNSRLYIMGHAKIDVNGRHYLSPPPPEEMLEALRCVPIVTTGLKPWTQV